MHAVCRCRVLEPTRTKFRLESAMNNPVSPDFSLLGSFCARRAEVFPDLKESLLLFRDDHKSLLNGGTRGAEIYNIGLYGQFRGALKSSTPL